MLQPILQEFLIENGYLPIASSGQLYVSHTPARLQEGDKMLIAPTTQLSFSTITPVEADTQKQISYLSRRLNISEQEAEELLKRENLVGDLSNDSSINNWNEWGIFKKEDGNVQFVQDEKINQYLPSIIIEKIWRQPVSETTIHTLQPAAEVANEVIFENEELVAKDYWWVWAILIFFLSVLFILFQFV